MEDIQTEATFDSEWVFYNDDWLRNIGGNWTEVVESMSAIGAYPTVLLYEKLETTDKYDSNSFKISEQDLDRIVKETLKEEEEYME